MEGVDGESSSAVAVVMEPAADGEHGVRHLSQTQLTEDLELYIHKCGVYDNADDLSERYAVMEDISQWADKWVTDTAVKQELHTECSTTYGACVKVFGGQSFGVVTKGGDLDLVCLVPRFVSRSDFFITFLSIIRRQNVTNLRPVEAAYVPVIKFCYKNIEIDLCLSVIAMDIIPAELDLLSNNIFEDMDELSIRSLSGIRENETLLSLLPDEDTFRRSLKVLKYWAKCQGIHHYAMGFPGGIGWAIMVARVCQLYPDAAVAVLVAKFFTVYLQWSWPTPVLLRPLQVNCRNLSQWNPQVSSADGRHLVPVITPAYPEHNATFTLTESTLQVLQQELARAQEITEKVFHGEATWSELFSARNFFTLYKHYLMVVAKASSDSDLLQWSGLVESRLRILTQDIERHRSVSLVHPHTEGYTDTVHNAAGEVYEKRWLLGLKLDMIQGTGTHLDLATWVKTFQGSVTNLAKERKIFSASMRLEVRHMKRSQLAQLFPSKLP